MTQLHSQSTTPALLYTIVVVVEPLLFATSCFGMCFTSPVSLYTRLHVDKIFFFHTHKHKASFYTKWYRMLRCRRHRKASQATSDPNVCVRFWSTGWMSHRQGWLKVFPRQSVWPRGAAGQPTHAHRHKHGEAQVAESLHAHRLSAFPLINGSDRRSRKRFRVSSTWNPHLWKAVRSERSQVLHFWCNTWISNVQLCLVHIQVTVHYNEGKKDKTKWTAHFLQRAADRGSRTSSIVCFRFPSLSFLTYVFLCVPYFLIAKEVRTVV